MFSRIKDILGAGEKKKVEEPQAVLPEIHPFKDLEIENAPVAAHRPDHIKFNINHGGHMRIVAKSDEEAANVGVEALKLTRDKKTIVYGDDNVSGYLSDFRYLKFLTITRNGDTLCTFPFFSAGNPIEARITEVTECENCYEGQLEIYTKGSALTFFDVLYFKNKNTYFLGKDAKVLLSGIAYVLTKTRKAQDEAGKPDKANEMSADSELAFRYENGDVDDYVFRGRIHEVYNFDVMGKKAQIIRVPLRFGVDTVIDIYVCATENAIKEKLHKGDFVSGIVWLQGFVV